MLVGDRNSVGFSACIILVLLPEAQRAPNATAKGKGDSAEATSDLWHQQKVVFRQYLRAGLFVFYISMSVLELSSMTPVCEPGVEQAGKGSLST